MRTMQRIIARSAGLGARLGPRGPVILLYHRVAEPDHDPFRLSVSRRNFAEHLDVLRESAPLLPLDRFAAAAARGELPPSATAITFDDGYLDNLTSAAPLLEQTGTPATVFVTTGALGSEFWWDRLDTILSSHALPKVLRLRIGERVYEWDASRVTHRRAWLRSRQPAGSSGRTWSTWLYNRLHPLLTDVAPVERQAALAHLAAWAGRPAAGPRTPARRALTPEELRRLTVSGLIRVGAHSVSHTSLAGLAVNAQRAELRESRAALEEITGSSVRGFAYPFGQRHDYCRVTLDSLRELGFAFACTAFPGVVRRSTSPYQLPRLWIEDWDGDEFARRLRRWLRPAT